MDLSAALAAAERELDERSGIGSACSEDRDRVSIGERINDEIERISSASSASKSGSKPSSGESARSGAGADAVTGTGTGTDTGARQRGPGVAGSRSPSGPASVIASDSSDHSGFMKGATSSKASCGLRSESHASGNTSSSGSLTHVQEIDSMQAKLDAAAMQDDQKSEQISELLASLASLKKDSEMQHKLRSLLTAADEKKESAIVERDDLNDRLAGLEALQGAKDARYSAELAKMRSNTDDAALRTETAHKRHVETLLEELRVSKVQCHDMKVSRNKAENERDNARRGEQASANKYTGEVAELQSSLNAANRNIARRERKRQQQQSSASSQEREREDAEATSVEVVNLEEILGSSRAANVALNSQLAQLRLEMMNMQASHDTRVTNLNAELDTQRATMTKMSGPKVRKKGKLKPNPLCSIDEEMDDDEIQSQAASGISGQVSGANDDDVADLDDFEDGETARDKHNHERVTQLTEELAAESSRNRALNDDIIAANARQESKVNRLRVQANDAAAVKRLDNEEIDRLKSLGGENAAQICKLQELLTEAHTQNTSNEDNAENRILEQLALHNIEIEDLQEKLHYAVEAKRLESMRLADTKRELLAVQAQHTKVVAELENRVRLYEENDASVELRETFEYHRTVELDRNRLQNELEALKVTMQSQLEMERHQHEAAIAKVRTELMQERTLRETLERSIANMRSKFASECQKAATDLPQLSTQIPGRRAPQESAIPAWLRCPSRSAGGRDGLKYSCQESFWQLACAIQNTMALSCRARNFEIIDASKNAYVVWGSAALRGSQFPSLIPDEGSREWLKQEISTYLLPNGAQKSTGFGLRDMGNVEFRNKLGSLFDTSMLVAHVPAEPALGKESILLILVASAEKEKAHAKVKHVPSGTPSVTSDDIQACDSISNVF
eukprot:TRINITY_DN15071_c0_g2_i1.p1 TRINITY_DN15071_c0_g2~~TRINITY_DN15071_c0_g2_i1.p1  ORF type:complete len:912 (+),score=161.63 TRINITY_DN15071_c0_g2_i1:90-2825(+)